MREDDLDQDDRDLIATLKESAHRPMTGPAPMDGCAEQPRDGRLYEPLP